MENKRIRVLVVDDSQNMRRLLSETLASSPQIEVVGTAADPYEARDLIVALRPDVLTLDIEMPKMDGITFLGKLMAKLPMPVIVVSTLCQRGSQAVVEALRLGAAEALVKPAGAREIPEFRQQLLLKVLGAAGARYRGALSAHSGGDGPLRWQRLGFRGVRVRGFLRWGLRREVRRRWSGCYCSFQRRYRGWWWYSIFRRCFRVVLPSGCTNVVRSG